VLEAPVFSDPDAFAPPHALTRFESVVPMAEVELPLDDDVLVLVPFALVPCVPLALTVVLVVVIRASQSVYFPVAKSQTRKARTNLNTYAAFMCVSNEPHTPAKQHIAMKKTNQRQSGSFKNCQSKGFDISNP